MLEAKIALIEILRKFSFVQAPETEVCIKIILSGLYNIVVPLYC